jgi:two-component system, OmpR family, alkaline phosphatase synthesis response regulator PhoP
MDMAQRILIVEDEPKIVEICSDYLKAAGFEVDTAGDGMEGLNKARQLKPDLVVLDLMLPGMDGLDVCRTLRRESRVPVIMLTARVEEADKLKGLELGADDYITKPFSPRELVARVRTVLRRANEPQPLEVLRAGRLVLDRSQFSVEMDGETIPLTPTEFELLYTLASQPGRIFSRSQLLMAARGVTFESYERAIDSHIRNLRRKLGSGSPGEEEATHGKKDTPRHSNWIVTVHGVGYKFDTGEEG